jgi:NitT/TauT family transport system substrate-binding protein
LLAAQGLQVTIVPVKGRPPSTQDLINGQEAGKYDITAGGCVTYIEDQLGVNMPKVNLRIIAEASYLQPNVLTLLVKGGSSISSVSQLRKKTVSVNAPNDIGTLLVDSLLVAHGLNPAQVHYANVPFPGVAAALATPKSHVRASFVPEPFVSLDEAGAGIQELADLDQGFTQDFPIQGYAVTRAWAQKYPNTLKAFTTALSQAQEIADTNRAAVEGAIEQYWVSRRRPRRSSRSQPSRWGRRGATPVCGGRHDPVRPAPAWHHVQGHQHDRRLTVPGAW